MSKVEKKPTTYNLPVELTERLRSYCEGSGRVQSIFVEKAIEEKLDKKEG